MTGIGERADVDHAVHECVDRHQRRADEHGMTIRPSQTTRGLVAAVLPRLLDVVLDNLVANAITPRRPGDDGERAAREAGGRRRAVRCRTPAPAFRAEHVARMFERFYRVEGARSGPGTGLGLAIVKHIAEEYGGRASIESVPGDGTTDHRGATGSCRGQDVTSAFSSGSKR